MEEKLYLVKSRGFRAYVIAKDPTEAWNKFKEWLDGLGFGDGYGYYWERDFSSVEIVADESVHRPKSADGHDYDDAKQNDKLIL